MAGEANMNLAQEERVEDWVQRMEKIAEQNIDAAATFERAVDSMHDAVSNMEGAARKISEASRRMS
jgi:hypothetical protein